MSKQALDGFYYGHLKAKETDTCYNSLFTMSVKVSFIHGLGGGLALPYYLPKTKEGSEKAAVISTKKVKRQAYRGARLTNTYQYLREWYDFPTKL